MAQGPTAPQRAWRAACPNCGAPVEFASAASPVAVCSYCRSTLARDGEALRRIGQSAELFDDHSPLQLGSSGRHQGRSFTLVGRLQMQYAEGRWNEWHALFDGGADAGDHTTGDGPVKTAWLSEDNGRYVLGFDASTPPGVPSLAGLRLGATVPLAGQAWQVAAITQAEVSAAQGELPAPPVAGTFTVLELRNPQGEVATLDFGEPARPRWSIGRSVALDALSLTGLREANDQTLKARSLACPSCGTALEIRLDSTQSIVCHQCKAVVDVSQGVGADLAHFAQDNPDSTGAQPLLPLGSTGTLALGSAPRPWQVVGYAERCELPEDADDERTFWREYLLYNRSVGFAFLVDAEDGWSYAVPITGAPALQSGGQRAQWAGTAYQQRFAYHATTTYVLGEFYWRVQRDQRSRNTDYAAGSKRLNREQTGQEITWSAGETLSATAVMQAFKLSPAKAAAFARDAAPLSSQASSGGWPIKTWLVLLLALVVVVLMVRACSRDDCDALRETFGADSAEYQQCRRSSGSSGVRTGGGSFGGGGGFGGGGHK